MSDRKPKPMIAEKRPSGTISAGEAATRLGVARGTVLNWFAEGKLSGWRNGINRRVFITVADVERMIRDATAQGSR